MAKRLFMADFVYNNTKNINISHTHFKFNYKYDFYIFYKKNNNFYFNSKSINELLGQLKNILDVYQNNIYYIHKL